MNRNLFARFSYPSVRELDKTLGEIDAFVEVTELAVCSFLDEAQRFGDEHAYVKSKSKQYSICVNLTEVPMLKTHLARHYITIVYESAEEFFSKFRNDHRNIFAEEWDTTEDSPLSRTIRNVALDLELTKQSIGPDLISIWEYYRAIRNWVVHRTGVEKAQRRYDSLISLNDEHKLRYSNVVAPNQPIELKFDDFICFSRTTKLIARKLCLVAQPTRPQLVEMLRREDFTRIQNNPTRLRNALCGKLRTEYGIDSEIAYEIVDLLMAH